MMNGPSASPWSARNPNNPGPQDGSSGTGDHDEPFLFDQHLSTDHQGAFSARQFARLLCLRSHVQDGDRKPNPLITAPVE